jgi:hypothetical protein
MVKGEKSKKAVEALHKILGRPFLLRIVKAKVEKSFITEWMFFLLILLVTTLNDSHSIKKEINIYVGVIEAQRESERRCRSRLEPDIMTGDNTF